MQAFPATEGVVYHYFEQLKDSAAPTTFRSFLSALGFAKHVFGLLEAEKVYFSGRVKGLADKLYCAKARLRQRSPLRVSDVERLEQICVGTIARSAPDRVAAGFFLFLVYARARFSDGQRVCSLSLASGSARFLEAKVSRRPDTFLWQPPRSVSLQWAGVRSGSSSSPPLASRLRKTGHYFLRRAQQECGRMSRCHATRHACGSGA